MTTRTTLVLGVGNDLRGDDAVGLVVARRIRDRRPRDVVVKEVALDGMLILDAWDGADSVVIVDAMSSGLEPGSIRRFDGASPLPARTLATSTHAFGVPQAIALARALDRLPRRLVVIGVEGAQFEHGAGLSPAVEAAVDDAVSRVLEQLPGDGDTIVHEQSLMNDLMRKIYAVASEQDADRIKSVRVRVGALAHMSPDHFREHFEHASAGGPADGARVEVVLADDPSDPHAQDIMLESVEVEVSG